MGHSYSHVVIHAIFSTKGRRPLIRDDFREALWRYMAGVASGEFGHAIRIGGTADHLHGLLLVRPDVAVATAIGKWKSLSSAWVHKTVSDAREFAWQTGYAAFSVSRSSEEEVAGYIAQQAQHHRRRTFEEEFIELLKRHEVEYDPRYVFD
jgi:putative transposase